MKLTDKDIKRFWEKVDKKSDDECWGWKAYKEQKGYGVLNIQTKYCKAHRVSYELYYGHFDKSLHVLHRCDNPPCVNPKHLFLGTNKDNSDDKVSKFRFTKKIQPNQVIELIEKYNTGQYTQEQLSNEYPISRAQITQILNGKRWSHLNLKVNKINKSLKISDEEISKIKEMYYLGTTQIKIAEKYGVTQTNISRIITGKRKGGNEQ